jgi:hypothetical protein
MNLPAQTPRLTTPPDSLVENVRQAQKFMDGLISISGPTGMGEGSADFLRELFPHLDDVTLAAFCAYAATNLYCAVKELGLSTDLIQVAIVFAENFKALAWSVNTPEAPEVTP